MVGVNIAERINAPTIENFLLEIRNSGLTIPSPERPPSKMGRLKIIPREKEKRKIKLR